jgi:hypothetical protein
MGRLDGGPCRRTTSSTLAIFGDLDHRASRDRQSRGAGPHGGPWGDHGTNPSGPRAAPARRRGAPREAAQAVAANCASTRSQSGREMTTWS